jgi:hypothetical protein
MPEKNHLNYDDPGPVRFKIIDILVLKLKSAPGRQIVCGQPDANSAHPPRLCLFLPALMAVKRQSPVRPGAVETDR